MQASQSYGQSLPIQDCDTDRFKNCSTETCPNRGTNPLKSTCLKDGNIHKIGYFCDVCKKQLQELEKGWEQNHLHQKGVEYDIGF